MLATFGLYLPLKDTLATSMECAPSVHTTPVALLVKDGQGKPAKPHSSVLVEIDDIEDGMLGDSSVTDLPRSMLKGKSGSHALFARFLKAYHIKTERKSTKLPREGKEEGGRSSKKSDVPRWMLVHKVRCDPDML